MRIILILFPYILITGLLQLLGAHLVDLDYRNYHYQSITEYQSFILNLASLIATISTIYIFIKFRYKEKFSDLGFHYFSVYDVYLGLIFGFTIMLLGFTTLFVTHQIKIVGTNISILDLTLSFFSFSFIAISEEILIRGYILGNLLKCMDKYLSLVISSIIFSAMHAFNPNMNAISYVNLFLSGLILGISFLTTKNLIFPIALHFSWNFFQGTIFGFNVSGLNSYSLINHERINDNIINGGLFGFEGSLIAIFLQLISIPIIYKFYKRQVLKSVI